MPEEGEHGREAPKTARDRILDGEGDGKLAAQPSHVYSEQRKADSNQLFVAGPLQICNPPPCHRPHRAWDPKVHSTDPTRQDEATHCAARGAAREIKARASVDVHRVESVDAFLAEGPGEPRVAGEEFQEDLLPGIWRRSVRGAVLVDLLGRWRVIEARRRPEDRKMN